ncbi:MAG: NAD-binding protein, partial [Rhodocyclaceae bacterium]|nr:NAD-binding protein [Rhodocyclaceae bacterium]
RPFRDIFMGVFFVTIGMLLDLGFVARNWDRLALAVALLVGGKGLVVLLLTLATRTPPQIGLRTAAQLAQAGEFGLVLMELARSLRLVPKDVFQVTMAAMLISMFLAPFLIERAARLSGAVARSRWAHQTKVITDIAAGAMPMEQHVIICGYGRTGERVGQFLAAEGIPYLALDTDPQRIRVAETPGGKAVFGSADRVEVLQAAGLARARAVVIAYPDLHSAERALRVIRERNSRVPVIVRASDDSVVARLRKAGATEVIPEVLEGSLMLAAETMAQMGIPVEQAVARVRAIRAERYATLRDYYRNEKRGRGGPR